MSFILICVIVSISVQPLNSLSIRYEPRYKCRTIYGGQSCTPKEELSKQFHYLWRKGETSPCIFMPNSNKKMCFDSSGLTSPCTCNGDYQTQSETPYFLVGMMYPMNNNILGFPRVPYFPYFWRHKFRRPIFKPNPILSIKPLNPIEPGQNPDELVDPLFEPVSEPATELEMEIESESEPPEATATEQEAESLSESEQPETSEPVQGTDAATEVETETEPATTSETESESLEPEPETVSESQQTTSDSEEGTDTGTVTEEEGTKESQPSSTSNSDLITAEASTSEQAQTDTQQDEQTTEISDSGEVTSDDISVESETTEPADLLTVEVESALDKLAILEAEVAEDGSLTLPEHTFIDSDQELPAASRLLTALVQVLVPLVEGGYVQPEQVKSYLLRELFEITSEDEDQADVTSELIDDLLGDIVDILKPHVRHGHIDVDQLQDYLLKQLDYDPSPIIQIHK